MDHYIRLSPLAAFCALFFLACGDDTAPTAEMDGSATREDSSTGSVDAPDAASPDRVFTESDGMVVIEAEGFAEGESRDLPRSWYLTDADNTPDFSADADPAHVEGASGGAYLESLPDTRQTGDDPFEPGALYNTGGDGPTLTYRVVFETTGTYYVWVRAYSTGPEDNGLHVGIDGEWPESGRRIQWCRGKNNWTWSNAKRDSCGDACGCDGTIFIEVTEAGEHTIQIAQREDGFELDQFLLTTDMDFEPEGAL
ncbi:MAG: hypothetical protein ACI9KE_005812 [Polyangiales bacterium]|jgi:hypothetical protein